MATISISKDKTANSVIIGFNVTHGNDPQPIYQAGEATISCVVEIEALAQVSIQRALFEEGQYTSDASSFSIAKVPALTINSAVVKYGYQASSGQAYVVEDVTIIGKKST